MKPQFSIPHVCPRRAGAVDALPARQRPCVSMHESDERRTRELRRANEILKAAGFFAAELDRSGR
jgi:hypothetical protein